MNIINKLTVRHLKENKKRTLVTVIGVIISVAMITAVVTLSFSFMDLLQRETMKQVGEWHVVYKDVNLAQISEIEADEGTKRVILSQDRGYGDLEGSINQNKPYLFVKSYNTVGFEQFPIELSGGRLPETTNEIVLSDAIADNADVHYEIGDEITVDIGERQFLSVEPEGKIDQTYSLEMVDDQIDEELINTMEESYTVVGFIDRPTWEPSWAPGYTAITYIDEDMLKEGELVNASVVLEDVTSSIYDDAENIATENQISNVSYNNDLLRYYGVTDNDGLGQTFFGLSAVIISVIMIGSIALIYNAFAISVSERSRHLGMLSSVGATKRQKMNSVFFEGAIIGLISIPIGLLSGFLGIGATFWFINSFLEGALNVTEELRIVVTPILLVISVAISMLTIFISTYLPARKASKVSAIDAIRQTTDVKLTKKAVKTPKIVRVIFGVEAEIALKNLKRNKRRYQVTVFSLVISIVLFLTVSFFTASLERSLKMSQDGVNFDIQIQLNQADEEEKEQLTTSITALPDVTESSVMKQLDIHSFVPEEKLGEQLAEQVKDDQTQLIEGGYPYYVEVNSLKDEALDAYATEIGVEPDLLRDKTSLRGILVDTVSYYDHQTEKVIESRVIESEVGSTIPLSKFDWETEEKTSISDIEISALTGELPMGGISGYEGGLQFFVSEDAFDDWIDFYELEGSVTEVYLNSADPLKTQSEIEEVSDTNIYVHNVFQRRQQEEQMILMMSIFTYGFIALITAISVANIFNTISTSISLRKREFAMLKSVGMTPKAFTKMMNFESLFYGIKALLYGIPISIGVMYLIHYSMMNSFDFNFSLPWLDLLYVIIAVFVIVSSAMLYSISKVKEENIIDALKQENI
ncbi:FtsX-like permease family protein [Salipaludibacillus sp. HK11]|uniref:ABC transporter permease n=1 Tax=Salipaludibacillus sp. HK11 TaxID=3394320 RepID=UPI0039FBCB30